MQYHDYFEKMKTIHQSLVEYLDEKSQEEEYQNLLSRIEDNQIIKSRNELENFLYLIISISNNFNRGSNFFNKINQLILLFKDEIKQNFTNIKIFKIFKTNKFLLLFLSKEKIFEFDDKIAKLIEEKESDDFISYFYPELKNFMKIELKTVEEEVENQIETFEEMRQTGENDNEEINKLIRNDLIEEFIIYVNKKDFPLSTKIKPSIFESHLYLISKEVSLIKYAAFFGSLQIFKYLYLNNCKLKPSLWSFAVYGCNPEIFQILIDNKINPNFYGYDKIVIDSIKSHHIEVTNYLTNNYSQYDLEDNINVVSCILKNRNFSFFPEKMKNQFYFFYLCKYNYVKFVDLLLKEKKVFINKEYVLEGKITVHIFIIFIKFLLNCNEIHCFLFSNDSITYSHL